MCIEQVETNKEPQTSAGQGSIQVRRVLSVHTPLFPLALAFPSSEEVGCSWLKDLKRFLSGCVVSWKGYCCMPVSCQPPKGPQPPPIAQWSLIGDISRTGGQKSTCSLADSGLIVGF